MKVSIDPGIGGLGLALWGDKNWRVRPVNPKIVMNINPSSKAEGLVQKTTSILEKIHGEIECYDVSDVYCEMPAFFDTVGGAMVAKRGDLSKLTYFVGVVGGYCYSRNIQIHLVPVTVWKGQTTKEMVERKIHTILPNIKQTGVKSHGYDAVGIGLWAQGLYKRS